MAKLEVGEKDQITDFMNFFWSEELTKWIPSSVNLMEIGSNDNWTSNKALHDDAPKDARM